MVRGSPLASLLSFPRIALTLSASHAAMKLRRLLSWLCRPPSGQMKRPKRDRSILPRNPISPDFRLPRRKEDQIAESAGKASMFVSPRAQPMR